MGYEDAAWRDARKISFRTGEPFVRSLTASLDLNLESVAAWGILATNLESRRERCGIDRQLVLEEERPPKPWRVAAVGQHRILTMKCIHS